ncbi:Uma2 family endonuclease [Streptomyces sp. NBC_00820]|uniref:Uma2 family endonuclease n=1 Tax=Streptomyces sp. NBC_00820 TaxID=2975842 RepID=UPI002ED35E60|nr:Uma2 family endonuclease [Streptomyces sp. NBC_00820]
MTAVDERGVAEFFEGFEPPDGLRMELLRGEIVMMASPDLVHNLIVSDVQDQIPRGHWVRLQTQDVDIVDEASEPVPDLVVVAPEVLPASGRLLPASLITMVVEVVSKTSVERDYSVKRSIYAAAGVPVYLVVDPIMAQCVLLTRPEGEGERADYMGQTKRKFGETLSLETLGVELDTSSFGILPDVKPHRWPLP